MPFVTPMPMTKGSVMILARFMGMPSQPINPASQRVPMATGNSDKITATRLRKWTNTMMAIAANEYHAACT